MKKCPFCAEEIQDAAIKCRFCGEFLDTAHPTEQPTESQAPRVEPKVLKSRTGKVRSGCFWTFSIVVVLTMLVMTANVNDSKVPSPSDSNTAALIRQNEIREANKAEQDAQRMLNQEAQSESEQPDASSSQTPRVRDPDSKYQVVERKRQGKALYISIVPDSVGMAERYARELIELEKNEQMVRVYVYDDIKEPGRDSAYAVFEWTKESGFRTGLDLRAPESPVEPLTTVPKYEILFKMRMIDGRVLGEILIPSVSPKTSTTKLAEIAEAILKHEQLDYAYFYSTHAAHEANNSATYYEANPNAMKQGFLGTHVDGKFLKGR